jgi:hypothetical protein
VPLVEYASGSPSLVYVIAFSLENFRGKGINGVAILKWILRKIES